MWGNLVMFYPWQVNRRARSKRWTRLCIMTGVWFLNIWNNSTGTLYPSLSHRHALSHTHHCCVLCCWRSTRRQQAKYWLRSQPYLYTGRCSSTKTTSKSRKKRDRPRRGPLCDLWTVRSRQVYREFTTQIHGLENIVRNYHDV